MRKLIYLEQAKQDLLNIKRYIAHESGNAQVAIRFTAKLREQCRRLAQIPGMVGRARPELHPDIRSFPFGNYVICFRYQDTTLEIVTIIEGHRDIESLFDA